MARDLARAANGERAEDHAAAAKAVWLLRSPTGAGKTTAALRAVLAIKAELAERGLKLGPVLFMAPSYSLLDDIVQRASGMTDPVADVEDEVARVGAAMAEAKTLGLRTMVYKGKGQWCEHPAWATLAAGGVGTSHICQSEESYRDPDTGEWRKRKVYCPWMDGCGFWLQRQEVEHMDIVFMPSAYLTLPIPEEVRAVAVGLIVDESMTSQFLASCHMPVTTLDKSRPEPTLSKRDKAAGVDGGRLVEDRHAVCAVARTALLSKAVEDRDPANALVAWGLGDPDVGRAELLRMLDSAVNVCGRAMDVHASVNPYTTADGAAAVVARRRLESHLGEDHRYWKVVRERVEALLADRAYAQAGIKITTAKGAWDHRLQVLRKEGEPATVRVAWRRRNSFAGLPTLLMDATSDPEIVRKLYAGRRVVVHDAPPCPPHLRVLVVPDLPHSDTSLTPWRKDKDDARWASATQVDYVRRTLDAVSVITGAGRVGVFSNKKMEVLLQTAWQRPGNADWLHNGALVGVDHMRRHAAAVIVGRMELPIPAIDSQVAALTYDDETPELPVDRLGTLLDAEGDEVRAIPCTRTVACRDGSDVELDDVSYAGAWARRVQMQAREGNSLQAIGRLRALHRDGNSPPPIVLILGRVVPEGIVVDNWCGLLDIARGPAARLAADLRRFGVLRYTRGFGAPPSWNPADPDQRVVRGEHPTQRGLAEVAWQLATGQEAMGYVPAHALHDGSMPRRLALLASQSRHPAAADPALRVVRAPTMEEGVVTPAECPKMRALIGEPRERRAAEAAALAMADRVKRAASRMVPNNNESRADEPAAGGELTTIAAMLALRPLEPGERANDPSLPYVAHERMPRIARAALAQVLAEDAAAHIENECLEPEPAPVPVAAAAPDYDALWAEMADLLEVA